MSISQKQLDANRRNAQRSTGPRTEDGKARSSQNATKHGILSREVIVTHPDVAEDPDDFDSLLSGLMADFSPHGSLEHLLVQQIAVCYWRLRRILRAESQEWGQVFASQLEPETTVELYGETTIIPHPTLPPPDKVETLLRYENSIQSQLTRSLTHLDRLQHQRQEKSSEANEPQNQRNEAIPSSAQEPPRPSEGEGAGGEGPSPDQTNPFPPDLATPPSDPALQPPPPSSSLSRSSLSSLLT